METVLPTHPIAAARPSPRLVWTGRILGGLVVAFLLFDAVAKLIPVEAYLEGTRRLGFAPEIVRPLGLVLLISTILYVIPRTQVLGALLLTAFLGGATATHVRLDRPFWFPVLMGAILWAALVLRNPRVRAAVTAPSQS